MALRRGMRTSSAMDDKDGMEKVIHVTDNVFSSPNPQKTVLAIVFISFLLGLMFSTVRDPYSVMKNSLVIFLVPGLLAALLSVPISNFLGGRLYLRRSTLMVLICQAVMMVMWLLWITVHIFVKVPFRPISILILTFPFFIWHTVLVATSDRRHARTVWSSALQPVLGLVGYHQINPLSAGDLLFGIGTMVVILISVIIFTRMARAPLKRNYDWDGLDLVKHMLAHWTEGVSEGVLGMEHFFDSFSVMTNVPLALVAFRSKKTNKLKGVIVVPGAHPGPFGHLSGSDMPTKISSLMGKKGHGGPFVMVPHSASTHDMNPSTTDQTIKIGAVGRKLLKDLDFSDQASRSARNMIGTSMVSQSFGDTLILVHDPSPEPMDDLDSYLGKDIVRHAKNEGISNTMFIDAHNCIVRGSECIYHHSPSANDLLGLAATSVTRSKGSRRDDFRIGYSEDTDLSVMNDGIGPAGIQAMVAEVGTHRTAYILIDGNNIMKGIVKDLRKALGKKVKEALIMTTDNHVANVTMGGFNAIGMKIDKGSLRHRITSVVEKAIGDLEDCEAGGASTVVPIKVFGPGATAKMTATINSTMSIMKIGAGVALAMSFMGCLVWYQVLTLIGYL